jgi:hypothetical protein
LRAVPESKARSFSATVNRETPQSKQTETSGNTKMPGLTRCSIPEKWIIISAVNSASLTDAHDTQGMTNLVRSAAYVTKETLSGQNWTLPQDTSGMTITSEPDLYEAACEVLRWKLTRCVILTG